MQEEIQQRAQEIRTLMGDLKEKIQKAQEMLEQGDTPCNIPQE